MLLPCATLRMRPSMQQPGAWVIESVGKLPTEVRQYHLGTEQNRFLAALGRSMWPCRRKALNRAQAEGSPIPMEQECAVFDGCEFQCAARAVLNRDRSPRTTLVPSALISPDRGVTSEGLETSVSSLLSKWNLRTCPGGPYPTA